MPVRLLTPFEKNHLTKFGINPEKITEFAEMPVEYITGFAKFFTDYFMVNPQVLIPRVETEELVDKIFTLYQENKEINFLEIGTGSGAIGLSLFNKFSKLGMKVTATLADTSQGALDITQKNIELLIAPEKKEKINLVHSDILSNFNIVDFDFCVANLPYIPTSRLPLLAESVKDFEPRLALDGGSDGLVLIRKLITELKEKNFTGDLFLEVDDTHDERKLNSLDAKLKMTWSDSYDKNRFAWFVFKKT